MKDYLPIEDHRRQMASRRVTVVARRVAHAVRFATPKRFVTNRDEQQKER